ncbi:MAG: ATP synthase F1 subunit gamma, partial [Patescibacteria group bacterium]
AAALSRLYANGAREALSHLRALVPEEHPFFMENVSSPALYIVFTSDRGLAGAYTTNVLKEMIKAVGSEPQAKLIIIGKRGGQLLARLTHSFDIIGIYNSWQHHPTIAEISPIARTAMKLFQEKTIGRVVLVYTDFHSLSSQETTSRTILPVPMRDTPDVYRLRDETISLEPSAHELLEYIVPRFVEVQVFQASIESAASEHASRMVAMHNASDNASDVIDSLTLEYNGARQAGVTAELAEISAGAEAIL